MRKKNVLMHKKTIFTFLTCVPAYTKMLFVRFRLKKKKKWKRKSKQKRKVFIKLIPTLRKSIKIS